MIDYDALLERLEVFGLGTIGKNITFDTMPETVTKGVCIRSRISGNVIDYEIPNLQRGQFRLIVRSARYEEGEKLLGRAIKALEILHRPENVGKMRVRYCRAETTPMAFPVSDGNLREFAVNMEICYDYKPDSEESLKDKIEEILKVAGEKAGHPVASIDEAIEIIRSLEVAGE